MKVSIQTLGCKVNQYESQAMELLLREMGHELASGDELADAYIINSCTVTATSDKKSRQYVRQAKKKNPQAVVALCGCYPQVSAQEARKLEADLIGGTGDRAAFLGLLESIWQERRRIVAVDEAMKRKEYEKLPGGVFRDRTRAMLKVEDGCVNFCSYCIIPYARGPVRSLPLQDAAEEAARLAGEGYREIVLTGIELSSWGRDLPGEGQVEDLIEAACKAAPGCRIRLGSLEPRTVTEDFCSRLSKLPNLCPQFHLSLQSGCDETLRRMGRRYDTADYLESVRRLRQYFERPGLTTDLIVGFPGETQEEFEQTLAFLETCGFSAMHIFPYSKRTGTPAATMPGQLTNQEKAARAKRAEALALAMERAYLSGLIGTEQEVLFEEERDGFWRGHAPNYVLVLAKGEELKNCIQRVRITAAGEQAIYGTIVREVEET